jgi:HEAT repeat protein
MNQKKDGLGQIIPYLLIMFLAAALLCCKRTYIKAQANDILLHVKDYDYGQNREHLSHFSNFVRKAYDSPQDLAIIEKNMLNLLNSGATFAAKQFICTELSIIGSEESVPTLTEMLKNDKEANIALYALERIPGAEVDEALRDAISESEGMAKIGIINTIGRRRDIGAIDALVGLLNDPDQNIVTAAAAALGNIGNNAAAEALAIAAAKSSGSSKHEILYAYLKCADRLAQQGNIAQASAIYNALYDAENALPIRSAALIGKIKAAGSKGNQEILSMIRYGDKEVKPIAIAILREVPATKHIDDIVAELPNLAVENQVQLLTALAELGNKTVHPSVVNATQHKDARVRVAALKALAGLGKSQDVMLLAEAAATRQEVEKRAARESLKLLNTPGTDAAIIDGVSKSHGAVKIELIKSIAKRNMDTSVDLLFGTIQDNDPDVRIESFKTLAMVAGPDDLARLIDLLVNVQNETERREAEKALVAVAQKIRPKEKQADAVLEKLPTVRGVEARGSLLQVLGRIADKDALPVLRASLENDNSDIQIAAIRALSYWPTPEPANDLLQVAQTSENQVQKVLALRGYIGLISLESDRPVEESIKMYETAMNLAPNVNEKRMVLSGLSNLHSLSALEMAKDYFNDNDLKQEAEVAAVKIAGNIRRRYPQKTKEILVKVIDTSTNERIKWDAQGIINDINEQ